MPAALPPFDYESALEAVARGDRGALRSLYERESRWLLAAAQRILRDRDRDRAHDVLQEAFLQIWQKAGTFQRALGSGRGWIYTVVRHRALDEARRHGRETAVGDDIEFLADAATVSDSHASPAGVAEALELCLGQLEPSRRQCIVYAFVEGYTHEQIAKALTTPVGTVKSWIRRGLLALKECLA